VAIPNPKSPKISESQIFSTRISNLDQIASFIDHCLTSSNKDHHHHCHIIISHHHMTVRCLVCPAYYALKLYNDVHTLMTKRYE